MGVVLPFNNFPEKANFASALFAKVSMVDTPLPRWQSAISSSYI